MVQKGIGSSVVCEESLDGTIDGLAGDAAAEKVKPKQGECKIGKPSGIDGADGASLAKGDGDAAEEEHQGGEDDGKKDATAGAAPCEMNAKRR
jgi:hypothetical protein